MVYQMLGLRKMVDRLAKIDGVHWWYGHVLRREEDDVVRKGTKTHGRAPKKAWMA